MAFRIGLPARATGNQRMLSDPQFLLVLTKPSDLIAEASDQSECVLYHRSEDNSQSSVDQEAIRSTTKNCLMVY